MPFNKNSNPIIHDNHFVPQMYLKRWEDLNKKVWKYNILVPNEKIKLWKDHSVKGIAFHLHLYTKIIAGKESDEIDKWFNKEFETPAEKPIRKIINEYKLEPDDWKILVRFLAAQDTRTPFRLIEHIRTSEESFQKPIQEFTDKLAPYISETTDLTSLIKLGNKFLPMDITNEFKPGEENGNLKVEIFIGRETWLYEINRLLTETIKSIPKQNWTILKPAIGMTWPTSDNPVIRLNPTIIENNIQRYNFKGGWGKFGNRIYMPINPDYLMYTIIGEKAPIRYTRISIKETKFIQRLIAENAHLAIYSNKEESYIEKLRPRTADLKIYNIEKDQWKNWHEQQVKISQTISQKLK